MASSNCLKNDIPISELRAYQIPVPGRNLRVSTLSLALHVDLKPFALHLAQNILPA